MLPCILCYDDLATELVWAPCIQTTYNHYGLIKRNSSSLLCRNCGCQLSLSIPFLIKFKARCAASVLCYSDLAWAGWLNGGGQHTHTQVQCLCCVNNRVFLTYENPVFGPDSVSLNNCTSQRLRMLQHEQNSRAITCPFFFFTSEAWSLDAVAWKLWNQNSKPSALG